MAHDADHKQRLRLAVGIGVLLVLGLLVAVFTSLFSDDSATAAAEPTSTTSTSTVPSTTSSLFEVTTTNENREPGDLPGELSLSECAWISPGKYQFEMTWEPHPDNEPVAVELSIALVFGDAGLGGAVSTVLDEPTTVIEVLDLYAVSLEANPRWPMGHRSSPDVQFVGWCSVSDDESGFSDATVPTRDPSAIDLGDPLLPLAGFEAQGGYELLDMIAIVPDRRLDSVRFQHFDSCTMVESDYESSEEGVPGLSLAQSHGCPDIGDGVQSPSGSWHLAFTTGEPVEVEWLALDGPAPDPAELSYDPDRALDARLDSSTEVKEVGRFDWEGSRVSIQTGGDPFDPRASLLPVIEPSERGGNQNFDCTEFSLLEYQRPNPAEAGFVVLVSDRSDIGLTFPIEMEPSLVDGLFIGFVDYATGAYEWGFEPWNPIEPDGSLVACTQE